MSALGGKQTLAHLSTSELASMRRHKFTAREQPMKWTFIGHLAVSAAVNCAYTDNHRQDHRPCDNHPAFRCQTKISLMP